jgi:hypothetical protein
LIRSMWKFQFALNAEIDREDEVVPLLEEILERVKQGQVEGRGEHSNGIYGFSLIEWAYPTQRKENE